MINDLHHRLTKLAGQTAAALPSSAGTRQLGGTAEELALESEWTQALQPALEDLYRYPLRNGLDAVPEGDVDEIRDWALDELDGEEATAVLFFLMNRYARLGFDVGGRQALRDMGIAGSFSLNDDDLIEALEAFVEGDLVATDGDLSLTRTTADDLARQIRNGREDELSTSELSAALATYITGRAITRSGIISLDNTVRFTRLGASQTYYHNGLNQVIHRTAPELTETGPCPICEPRDGNVYNITNGIVVGDNLPLHALCILPRNKVVAPGRIEAATKSFYNGRCIEITTGNGRKLSVTPNHPILTREGWFPAQLLCEGMDVVGATETQGFRNATGPHDYNVPAPIEEMWNSLHMSPAMVTVSMPLTAKDFHGDGRGMDGDIHIVYPKRLLLGNGIALCSQHLGEFVLGWRHVREILLSGMRDFDKRFPGTFGASIGFMRGGNVRSPLLTGQRVPPQIVPVRVSAQFNAVFGEAVGDGLASYSKGRSKLVGRFSTKIPSGDFFNGEIDRRPSTPMGAISVNPRALKPSRNGLGANFPVTRKLSDGLSIPITSHKIVKIREFDFTGHVYDLQVAPYHFYFTEGIVTHNCVCYHLPAVEGDPLAETDWTPEEGVWTGG